MMLALAGLHGSGKSHLSSGIAAEFGWTVCVKRDILKLLHDREGIGDDWVEWYRALYASEGAYEVTRRILDLVPSDHRLIFDSVHSQSEWNAITERRPDAILAFVIAPKAMRIARSGPEDESLDAQRTRFWHSDDGSCLVAESGWCFNGAACIEVQMAEFEAFLIHHAIR